MDIREMRQQLGDTQGEFSARYNIPFRTIQNWETGVRTPPQYVVELLERQVRMDFENHKTWKLPEYDPKKPNLPDRRNYVGALSWLKDVQECLGEPVVFALDEALMCLEAYGGQHDQFLVWIYGDSSLAKYNGVVVIGNKISPRYVISQNGLQYTDLNRTLLDSIANESILDMQGITQALSDYYYSNGERFSGLFVPPEYQEKFDSLANDAIEYYSR